MKKKLITLIAVFCLVFTVGANAALAAGYSIVSNNTSSIKNYHTYNNDSGSRKEIHAHLTVTAGTGGAWVTIRNSANTELTNQARLYPYQTAINTDLVVGVSSGVTRQICVKPNMNGQNVKGNLYWKIV